MHRLTVIRDRLRALASGVALATALLAGNVPVVHTIAHLVHDQGHEVGAVHDHRGSPTESAVGEASHDHDAVHPAALHDRADSVTEQGFPLLAMVPVPTVVPLPPSGTARETSVPAITLASRPPPRPDLPRAPPFV